MAKTINVAGFKQAGNGKAEDETRLQPHNPPHPGGVAPLQHLVLGGNGVEIAHNEVGMGLRLAGDEAQELANGLPAAQLKGEQQIG